MKADNGSDEVNRNRDSKKWSNSGHSLEVSSMGVAYKLDRNMWKKIN